MKDTKILKIAIIIVLFLILFTLLIIISIRSIDTTQSSNKTANLVTNNNENETEKAEKDENAVIDEEDVYTDSIVIRTLVNNNWSRLNSNFSSGYELDENRNYVYEDGYTIYTDDGVNVRNVVFNQNYEDEVISNLRVGASYDEIVQAFESVPTFENEQLNLYGYKTVTVYAFFHDNEISIYPNTNLNNSDFEEILFEYLSGNYSGNQTNFVVNIRNNFSDFSAELDGETVVLTSENRQIQIRLNGDYTNTEVILYNGYVEGELMSENKELYSITEDRSLDLVEIVETERIMSE